MRIAIYSTEIGTDMRNILVKEDIKNCPDVNRLDSPEKVKDMINYIYNANVKAEEYMWLIALNTNLNPIGLFEISHGTVNSSLITPREVFVRLCLCGATYCILAHNHPGGNTSPSTEDLEVTSRIKEAGEIINIRLLDHIIIGQGYYSFKENREEKGFLR